MKRFGKVIFAIGAIIGIAILGLSLPRGSNCGGNCAAINVCKMCALDIHLDSDDRIQPFNIFDMSQSNKADIARVTKDHWIQEANFYLRTNIPPKLQSRGIIVVCDTPYSNLPKPTIWNGFRKNTAHAAGFSDGTVGLISPNEFKKLNLSNFVEARQLLVK